MAAATQNVTIERGATWQLGVQWPEGAPNDLHTGWTAVVQLRAHASDAAPVADASAYVTLSAGSPTTDNISLAAPPAWTLALADGSYVWALLLQQPGATPPTDFNPGLFLAQTALAAQAAGAALPTAPAVTVARTGEIGVMLYVRDTVATLRALLDGAAGLTNDQEPPQ